MRRDEMTKILTMVAALDRQPVDEAVLEMWMRLLGEYTFEQVEAAVIPAYKESNGFLTAKGVWDVVRRSASQPKPRAWVKELHDMGQHFECRAGEFGHPQEVLA